MRFKLIFSFLMMASLMGRLAHAHTIVAAATGTIFCAEIREADRFIQQGLATPSEMQSAANALAFKAMVTLDAGKYYLNPTNLYREISPRFFSVPSISKVSGIPVPVDGVGADLIPVLEGVSNFEFTLAGLCEFLPNNNEPVSKAAIIYAAQKVLSKTLRKFAQ